MKAIRPGTSPENVHFAPGQRKRKPFSGILQFPAQTVRKRMGRLLIEKRPLRRFPVKIQHRSGRTDRRSLIKINHSQNMLWANILA